MSQKIKIGVTGAGGGVGQSIIKSLYESAYEVVALDGETLGTGLYAAPSGYQIPYAKSADFIPQLISICKEEQIKLLFPGMDAELKPLSLARKDFEAIGTTVVVSEPDVIDISNDKLLTYRKLTELGIQVPITRSFDEYHDGLIAFPIIVKQQIDGARSKNVYLLKTREELTKLAESPGFNKKDFIIQEYIEGDEYTCGSVNLDGKCHGVIVMRRILRDGDTYKCFSIKNSFIEERVETLMNLIKPFGACNVQLRLRDGVPYIFEINARCSGTTGARALCGFNEPKMIADYLLMEQLPQFNIQELSIFRYWQELAVPNDEVLAMQKDRKIHHLIARHL